MAELLDSVRTGSQHAEHPPAPKVLDGRFFNELGGKTVPPEVLVPMSPNDRPMSPIEASTGIPLPIVGPKGRSPNRHHAFFYERNYINGTLGQQAVRLARIQRANRYVHQNAHKHLDGTAFPISEAQEWEIAVLSLAGYVPDLGVKFKKRELYVEGLTVKEKKSLRRPGTITPEKSSREQGKIGEFLLKYAYENLDRSEQLWVEEFLGIQDDAYDDGLRTRKLVLAEKLTNRAIETAVDPVRPVFTQARESRRLRVDSPNSAWQVVKSTVGKSIPGYVDFLEDKLAQQFGA